MNALLRIAFAAALVLAIAGLPRAQERDLVKLSDELSIRRIADDAFLVTHDFPWPGNSLLVRLDVDTLVWVDTPYTPEATATVLDWVHARLGASVSIVEINTGFHIDNLGGNAALIGRGIPVYGSGRTRDLLRTKSAATMRTMASWLAAPGYKKYRDAYEKMVFREPTVLFDIEKEQRLEFGGEAVIVYFPGPTHTYDNLVVYFPKRKLLFGGCMIVSADAPRLGYVADGNLTEWGASLRKLEERFPDATLVVPGHGNAGGPDLVRRTMELVEASVR